MHLILYNSVQILISQRTSFYILKHSRDAPQEFAYSNFPDETMCSFWRQLGIGQRDTNLSP